MSEKKYPIKWEYKSHSYQIADTGDYDGYWEVTNGKDSLITKEDYDDIEKDLQAVVDLLNNTYANFTFDRGNEAALDAENKWLKSDIEQLKAKSGAVWVKASVRLPSSWHLKCVRFIHTKQTLIDPQAWLNENEKAIEVVEWLDESVEQPGREVAFTAEDSQFMQECNLYPTSNGLTVLTENDEGASIPYEDILKLSSVLYRYAIKQQKEVKP